MPEFARRSEDSEIRFPRIGFGGNSPRCIKTDAAKGHDYYCSLPAPILGSVLPFQPKRLVLQALGLAAACNSGRILMQDPA
jgi:hypothetical protein